MNRAQFSAVLVVIAFAAYQYQSVDVAAKDNTVFLTLRSLFLAWVKTITFGVERSPEAYQGA